MPTSKPDLTRVWASGAPGANVVDPDTTTPGKFIAGWTAEVPPFEHFNFLQQMFTQGLTYNNEQGINEWDTDTTYPIGAIVKGSDLNLYKAILEQSSNNPVSDNGTNWQDYRFNNSLPSLVNSQNRNIEFILCSIRQDAVDPTIWNFISDADHEASLPTGATIDAAPVGSNTIRINLNKSYSKIVGAAVVPDEDLSQKGITVGASVDNAEVVLYLAKNKQLKASVWYDGAAWQFSNESTGNGDMSPEISGAAFVGNSLQITHKQIDGSNVSVSPLSRAAAPAIVPYMSCYAGGNGSTRTDIKFVNTSGNFVGAADNKMVVQVNWYDGTVETSTYKDSLNDGNIWVMLAMEV